MNCVLRHKNRAWDGGRGHKIHTWRGDIKHPGWMGGGGGGNFGFRSLIIYLVLVMLKKRTELKCAFDTMSFKYIFVIAVLLKLGFDAISLCSTF